MHVDVFTILRGLESSVYFQLHKFSLWRSGKELLWEKTSCIAVFDASFMRNGSANAIKVYLTQCNPRGKTHHCTFSIYHPEICYFATTKGKTRIKPLSEHPDFIRTQIPGRTHVTRSRTERPSASGRLSSDLGALPPSLRPSRGRPTGSAANSAAEPLQARRTPARSPAGSAVSTKAARRGSLPEPPSRRPSRCPSGAAPPAPPPPKPRYGPPCPAPLLCLGPARPALTPRGRPSAAPGAPGEELGVSHAPRAAPSRRHRRDPPLSAPAQRGRAAPGPAPCPGQALPLMSGRAGPRWRLLPARHGTARRGGRGGRRGGGLRCALPAPPRWKEAVPGERWAPARLSLLFYDHQFSPLVRAGRLAAAFTLIGVIKSKGITLAKSFRRIYLQMNRSAHGTAGGARRSGPEPPGTARPRVRRLQCL